MKRSVLSISLLFLLGCLISSCTNRKVLSQLTNTSFDILQYDKYSDTLWAAEYFLGENIYIFERHSSSGRFDLQNAKKTIEFPLKKELVSFCVLEDAAWIGLTGISETEEGGIYKYDKSKNKLDRYSELDVYKCKTIDKSNVLFWGDNKAVLINKGEIKSEFETPDTIYDAAQDIAGNVWIADISGNIYKTDATNHLLQTANEYELTKLSFDRDGNLWAVNRKYIARYKNGDLSKSEKIAVDINDDLRGFFQDQEGNIWFIMKETILKYERGRLLEIDLPEDLVRLRFGGIDLENNTAYISSGNGVYLLELSLK